MKTKEELKNEATAAKQILKDLESQIAKIEAEEQKKAEAYTELDSFEKCCAVTGDDPKNLKFTTGDFDTQAYEMLKVMTKAINGGKKLGRTSYTPIFDETKKPGAGFCNSFVAWGRAGDWRVGVSFRLRFIDEKRAIFAGKTFEKIYYQYMSPNQ